jgi:hypothetical protein
LARFRKPSQLVKSATGIGDRGLRERAEIQEVRVELGGALEMSQGGLRFAGKERLSAFVHFNHCGHRFASSMAEDEKNCQ